MAAKGPPAPLPHTLGATSPCKKAALPATVEAETPQDHSQTTRDGAAARRGESCCSEEIVLDCTFAACDPEQTGTVLPWRVVEYVKGLTGLSGQDGRLRALHRMLDPEAAGAALDLPTFCAAMREWIISCQQDGGSRLAEERDAVVGDVSLALAAGEGRAAPEAAPLEGNGGNTDIASLTEAAGLRSRAEQLAAENAKLQQDVEVAEELNARLAEEMAQLKAQLRCSQQVAEKARAATEELEDLKAVAKGLEEENGELRRQARRLEKEQRGLCSRADGLQEENQWLLAEGQGLRDQIKALAAETADLEAQLCHSTALLATRDTALTQARQQVEELTVALEGYGRVVQELRLETTQLRGQLGRMQDACAMQPWDPLGEADVPAQPLGAEISAMYRETEEEEDAGMVAPGTPAGHGEEPAEPQRCPGPSQRLPPPWALPAPPAPPRAPVLPALLVLLALLALLCLLPRCRPGLPHCRVVWPQPWLHHQGPPPQ